MANNTIKIEIDVSIYSNQASKAEMSTDRTEWNAASNSEKATIVKEFILSEVLNVSFKEAGLNEVIQESVLTEEPEEEWDADIWASQVMGCLSLLLDQSVEIGYVAKQLVGCKAVFKNSGQVMTYLTGNDDDVYDSEDFTITGDQLAQLFDTTLDDSTVETIIELIEKGTVERDVKMDDAFELRRVLIKGVDKEFAEQQAS